MSRPLNKNYLEEFSAVQIKVNRLIGLPKTKSQNRIELRYINEELSGLSASKGLSEISARALQAKIIEIFMRNGVNFKFQLSTTKNSSPKEVKLSRKEYEVLRDLPQGESIKNLAKTFNLSEATIKSHLSAIYRKLEVKNRVQAINKAKEIGLINS